MDTSKPIPVGVSSSLIDLKAELLRKQEELRISKSQHRGASKSVKKSDILKQKSGKSTKNKGVEKRSQKDLEAKALEDKSIERSRSALEAKAKLYEQMTSDALKYDEHEHPVLANSLVNFQQKAIDNMNSSRKIQYPPASESAAIDINEEDWTEFTDALGRTRRCLRADLPAFMARDSELTRPENPGICLSAEADDRLREMQREKWEKQQEKVAAKDHVHYQDVLFDEVRSHGVAFYGFSKDDTTREQQIHELKKLSKETEATREKVLKERGHKRSMLKDRLKKVRERKRARLGLQPLEEDEKSEEEDEEGKEKKVNLDPDDEVDEEKDKLPPEMRAWDFGKPGVYGPKPMNFDELDEKWLKDRRADRNSQFAPPTHYKRLITKSHQNKSSTSSASSTPSPYSTSVSSGQRQPNYTQNYYGSFVRGTEKIYQPEKYPSGGEQKPMRIEDEMPAPDHEDSDDWKRDCGIEVPPPPTFEYYRGDIQSSSGQNRKLPADNKEAVEEAVSSGLKALREMAEKNKKSTTTT